MPSHDDALSLRDARGLYFAAAGFDESSYTEKWVRLKAGPLALYMPNTPARVRAVRFHDLHHVLTGYATDWTGEAEIGAWEIASGCADHWAAWHLNFLAMAIGLAIAPRRTFRAFVRGLRSRNFYREEFGEALLAERVGEARRRLRLDAPVGAADAGEIARFAAGAAASVLAFAATFALTFGLVGGGIALLLGWLRA